MTTFDLTYRFTDPFYTGPAVTVPRGGEYDISIGGVGYLIDWESGQYFHESIPQVRQQADSSNEPGEQSLNPEDLWRRSQSSWHGGAGQTYLDLLDVDGGPLSTRKRFRVSKGIDPWTFGEIRLHRATSEARTSAAANCNVVVAGSRCYMLDNDTLYYSTNLTAWTQVTPTAAALSGPTSIATDGYNVWVCDATNLYYTTTATSTYSQWHAGAWANCTVVRYAKGRLFTAKSTGLIYNNGAQGSAAPGSALNGGTYFVNSGWLWADVAEGPNSVYAAGYAGDKSVIYRTAVADDGTGLDPFVVAGELPDGETVRALCGYLGFLLVGTTKGVRLASLDTAGNIVGYSDVIPTDNPVLCFEPQDRFVWYGLTNFDSSATGLGRIDLRTLTDSGTPAWATDLHVASQGAVNGVATFQNRRVFAIAADGLYAESTTAYVTSGTLNTGWFGFGIADEKTAVQLDTSHAAGAGSYTVTLFSDHQSTGAALGVATTTQAARAGTAAWGAQLTRGEVFEIRFALAGDGTATPRLKRWTLRAQPGSQTARKITVPIVLHEKIRTKKGRDVTLDVHAAKDRLISLRDNRTVTVYQEGPEVWQAVVDNYRWVPYGKRAGSPNSYDGTMILELKVVRVL